MEKLVLRQETLSKALKTLGHSLAKLQSQKFEDYEELRDSIIQRFEYSTDTFWKFLKDYLYEIMKIEVEIVRPKVVLKECFNTKLISEQEYLACINLVEDRNMTSHGYNEDLAEEISSRIPGYYKIMNNIVIRLQNTIQT